MNPKKPRLKQDPVKFAKALLEETKDADFTEVAKELRAEIAEMCEVMRAAATEIFFREAWTKRRRQVMHLALIKMADGIEMFGQGLESMGQEMAQEDHA